MALKINHRVEIDLKRTDVTPVLRMKQGDTASREVTIALFCDGAPWAAPSEVTVAKLAFCKPDRIGGEYSTIDGDSAFSFNAARTEVTMQIHAQVLTVAGNVVCELRLIGSSGAVLCAFNFIIYAEKSPLGMMMESHGLEDVGGSALLAMAARLDALEEIVNNAVLYTAQIKNAPDKAVALNNIGAASASHTHSLAGLGVEAAASNLTWNYEKWTLLEFLQTITQPGRYVFSDYNVLYQYELVKAQTQDGTMFYGTLKSYSGDETLFETSIYSGISAATISLVQ